MENKYKFKMDKVRAKIKQSPVIPVYYHDDIEKCIAIMEACYNGGVRFFEFVNRGKNASSNFKELLKYKNEHLPDLNLGIGTIKNIEQATHFYDLGAEFIVSPIINEEIAEFCKSKHIFWVPGCMTPTEIAIAERYNAPLVKLFPGDVLGIGFLKSVKGLFPDLYFMPTGGVKVDQKNIRSWFNAGVLSVGLGSQLFKEPEGASDYSWLVKRCQLLLKWANEN